MLRSLKRTDNRAISIASFETEDPGPWSLWLRISGFARKFGSQGVKEIARKARQTFYFANCLQKRANVSQIQLLRCSHRPRMAARWQMKPASLASQFNNKTVADKKAFPF